MGFSRSLRDLYEDHLRSDAPRRDLRFKPQLQLSGPMDERIEFERLDMGDQWDDANLLGPMLYLFNGKHLRRGKDWAQETNQP